MSGEVGVRFIALFVLFDRTQGPLWERKAGQGDLKFHFDQAAWVLPGGIYMGLRTALVATVDSHWWVRLAFGSLYSSYSLTARNAPFGKEKPVKVI